MFFYFIFFQRENKERERKEETHRCERETSIGCLSHAPQTRDEPATQVRVLTGNRTDDLSSHRMTCNQMNHTGQGMIFFYHKEKLCLPKCYFCNY